MTSTQLVERLENLANRKTFYKNKYPYNLCYINSDGRTSADCVNLYKALLNGYDVNNKTVGYYQHDLSNTGDCTEWGLMSQCTDVSQDFKKLKAGEPRLLYMKGHIGGYIGKEVTRSGKVYNCIECTTSFGGGIVYSYVSSTGGRYSCKNGSKNGAWTHNGKMTKWVSYGSTPQPQPTPTPSPSDEYYIVQAGDTLSGIAKKFNTTVDNLLKLNPQITDPNKIYVGQKIKVKGDAPSPAPKPTVKEGYTIGATYTTVPSSGLNVRTKPSLSAPYAGNCLPKGTKVTCLDISKEGSNVWMQIGTNRWCCAKQGSNVYIK